MFYYNLVSVICLGLLLLEAFAVLMNIVFSKRAERIEFFRGFKRGKYALIMVIALPLYFIGHVYGGADYLKAFFASINNIVHLLVLRYDVSSIEALMQNSDIYSVAVYSCFGLVVLNALFLTISLTGQYLWEYFQKLKLILIPRDRLIICGFNDGNKKLYLADKKRSKIIVDDIKKDDADNLYVDKVSYISTADCAEVLKKYVLRSARSKRKYIIVINTGSDERNILLCRTLIDAVSSLGEEVLGGLFKTLGIYVFGDPKYEAIYEDMISSGNGCFHYVNKYQKIAVDFIDRYPLSKFMDESHIDYEGALIRPEVDINVMLVGFGRVNREIFLTSVANNQFLTRGEGDPELKLVKYHIFDKEKTENDKNLNHSYYRFKHECKNLDPEKYLPLPTLPAEEIFHRIDINDFEFYDSVYSIVKENPKSVNFIVIAFSSDLENIDLAEKLVKKREEWGASNLVIFVKANGFRKSDTLIEEDSCFFIGNDEDSVYNIDNIISDNIQLMARRRNEVYDLEYALSESGITEPDAEFVMKNKDLSEKKWHLKSSMERDSSLFSCLSLRLKLHLLGLDYVPASADGEALEYDEYIKIYAGKDAPNVDKYALTVEGKPTVAYTLDFPKSRRRNLAVHEHQRWNSFMLSRGTVPATLEEIKNETVTLPDGRRKFTNGKSYKTRKHGNLTTFDGLVTFRRIVAERDGRPEADCDVIKYDYQLLDEAYWLLTTSGYKIINIRK